MSFGAAGPAASDFGAAGECREQRIECSGKNAVVRSKADAECRVENKEPNPAANP